MAVYNPTGAGNVHIDRVLTQISIGWTGNQGFVGERLFPTVPVNKQSDLYYVHGREAWFPERGDERAPGTEANEIPGMQVSTQPYYAREHALQIPVTDEERENADSPLSPDRDGTELVTQKILLGRELIFRNLATTAGNYATNHSVTLSGTDRWSSDQYAQANSDPIADIKLGRSTIHSKIFMDPNTVVVPYQVMTALEDHPKFLNRIQYSDRAIFTPDLLSALFGIPNWIVPGVGYNAANNYGAAESLAYLWGDDVILAWVPPRPGLRIPAYGYEFAWRYPGAGAQAVVQVVDRWREQRRKSDIIRVSRRYDVKMTALDSLGKQVAGYIIKDVLT
jgi:hypothetical protein